MADEQKNDADTQEDEVEDLPAEGTEAEIDWQAEARKREGIAKRNATKAAKLKAELEEERKKSAALAKNGSPEKKEGFDNSDKAYLIASGIKRDEFSFVQEAMKETGKDLDALLESKWFQSELKDRRDAQASKDAVPSGTRRSTTAARDTVEYWVEKGELPPADQRELRIKVVNARMKKEQDSSVFTNRSVI